LLTSLYSESEDDDYQFDFKPKHSTISVGPTLCQSVQTDNN